MSAKTLNSQDSTPLWIQAVQNSDTSFIVIRDIPVKPETAIVSVSSYGYSGQSEFVLQVINKPTYEPKISLARSAIAHEHMRSNILAPKIHAKSAKKQTAKTVKPVSFFDRLRSAIAL